jgi:hypothetical protein
MATPERIDSVILNQLEHGEMRLLALLVSVRKSLSGPTPFKGDLGKAVNGALRRLVASRAISDTGGVYSIMPRK